MHSLLNDNYHTGIRYVEAHVLKHMTNDEQIKQLSFEASNGLLLSHSDFPWFDLKNFDILYGSIVPDVYMTNYAFAHKFAGYTVKNFQNEWMKEYNYWRSYFSNNLTATTDTATTFTSTTITTTRYDMMIVKKKPRYLFYQNAKELQGRRKDGNDRRSNVFREENDFLRLNYSSLGFSELDEYGLSIGRLPHTFNPSFDGWHILGTIRKMEVIVLMNMLCNQ